MRAGRDRLAQRRGSARGAASSRLAAASTWALADSIITTMLALGDVAGRRYEVCSAIPEVAETFARLYPGTRFVCLYRSWGGFLRAVFDASPWGMSDPAFVPFTRAYPASNVATLTAYWTAHTASLLAFERSHPSAILRVRFEDLAGPQTAQAVLSFLGVAGPGSDTAPFQDNLARPQPAAPRAETGLLARPELDLPANLIPPAMLTQASHDLLRQLDYPALATTRLLRSSGGRLRCPAATKATCNRAAREQYCGLSGQFHWPVGQVGHAPHAAAAVKVEYRRPVRLPPAQAQLAVAELGLGPADPKGAPVELEHRVAAA